MKAYILTNKYDDSCPFKESLCVIADTANEAKSLAIKNNILDSDYIDLRVKISKDANIDGLSKGVFDDDKGLLLRNICTTICYMTCPHCGKKETTVEYDKINKFSCDNCEDNNI